MSNNQQRMMARLDALHAHADAERMAAREASDAAHAELLQSIEQAKRESQAEARAEANGGT